MQAAIDALPLAFLIWVFAVGAVVGSFLNVVIARVPRGESIVSPPSRCPRCMAPIRWYDNIPIASWLLLRAKCRNCGLPISARYPMVELLTGLIAVAVVRHFGATAVAAGMFVFASALVALAYIDIDTWLLPHQITWPLIGVGIASPLWNHALSWTSSLAGCAAGFAAFAAIALFGEKVLKRETMGWGDVWLLAGIGAWLGWQSLVPVVMLSALQGSAVGIALIAAGRDPAKGYDPTAASPAGPSDAASQPAEPASNEATPLPPQDAQAQPSSLPPEVHPDAAAADEDWVPPKHAVPFGPFLSLAALEVLLAGDALFALWDRLLGNLIR